MKKLYFISGTMGVGKTAVCRILNTKLDNSVFLDGDWCWNMSPFSVTEETKELVMENITYLLNNYIKCSQFDNIVFCWVMHKQKMIDEILSSIDSDNCEVKSISLVCRADVLKSHLQKDISDGIRTSAIIEKSISYLSLYDKLNTYKIDVSDITALQAADRIIKL